jgi:protein tyrosine phosphatase (PTP) superfamily phosphohydrolase (DUF442 family)
MNLKKILIIIVPTFCIFFVFEQLWKHKLGINYFDSESEKIFPNPKLHVSAFRKLYDNFHTVESGKLYRSKQLSERKLRHYIKKLGIKAVINLRGNNKHMKWWSKERKIAHKLGVNYFDVALNANFFSSKRSLLKLLRIYHHTPRPILIHCEGGSDRTGEAAALWLLTQQNKNKKEALKQLNWTYGHFESKCPLKRFFINAWKGEDWLKYEYDPKELEMQFNKS